MMINHQARIRLFVLPKIVERVNLWYYYVQILCVRVAGVVLCGLATLYVCDHTCVSLSLCTARTSLVGMEVWLLVWRCGCLHFSDKGVIDTDFSVHTFAMPTNFLFQNVRRQRTYFLRQSAFTFLQIHKSLYTATQVDKSL
jgi:hypothetical protein